jgi:lysozyme
MAQINAAGLALVKRFEGCVLTAYQDQGGVWTIGYGHTINVHEGDTCTQEQADAWLLEDLQEATNWVEAVVEIALNPNPFSALISFEFNTGGLSGSTMLKFINEGNLQAAAAQFGNWVYVNGQVSPGLVRRRAAEKALFLTPG